MLNCFIGCPDIFVTDAEINGEEYVDLPFIFSYRYENIRSFYLHKQLLPEHGKTCPLFFNSENVEKVKVTNKKSFVLKSFSIMDFYSEYLIPASKKWVFCLPHVYIRGENQCKGIRRGMFLIQHNKYG